MPGWGGEALPTHTPKTTWGGGGLAHLPLIYFHLPPLYSLSCLHMPYLTLWEEEEDGRRMPFTYAWPSHTEEEFWRATTAWSGRRLPCLKYTHLQGLIPWVGYRYYTPHTYKCLA